MDCCSSKEYEAKAVLSGLFDLTMELLTPLRGSEAVAIRDYIRSIASARDCLGYAG